MTIYMLVIMEPAFLIRQAALSESLANSSYLYVGNHKTVLVLIISAMEHSIAVAVAFL